MNQKKTIWMAAIVAADLCRLMRWYGPPIRPPLPALLGHFRAER